MKRILSLLILLAIGIAGGLLVAHHPGMVRIDTSNYHISSSLWVAAIALLITALVLQAAYRLFFQSIQAPKRLKQYLRMKRARKARQYQDTAWRLMIQGYWADAALQYQKASKKSPSPSLSHLGSAYCWERVGNNVRAKKESLLADTCGGDTILIDISKAKQLLHEGNRKQALILLKRHHTTPSAALTLLFLALEEHRAEEAMEHLKHAKPTLSDSEYNNHYARILSQSLQHCTDDTHTKELQKLWRHHKRNIVDDPSLHAHYLSALARCGDALTAHKHATKALHKHWHEAYLRVFQKTAFNHLPASLNLAEQWLTQYPNTPSIHNVLGHLYLESGRYHKAVDHFKEAYAATKDPRTAYRLGQAYTQLGSMEEGIHWYAQGCLRD